MKERPQYAWLREYKKIHGKELLKRHGAHSMGIGWKKVNGIKSDEPSLIFYVERKIPMDELAVAPIPPKIIYRPTNSQDDVCLLTDVVETHPVKFE